MPIYNSKGVKVSENGTSILQSPNLPYHFAFNRAKKNVNRPSCSVLFITDIHGDADRFKRFMDLANLGRDNNDHTSQNIAFDVAICGGDTIHADATETDLDTFEGVAIGGIKWFRDLIPNFKTPFLPVIGNHDCGFTNTIASYTTAQVYNRFVKDTTLSNNNSLPYGYYDDTTHKVRFIVLYDFDSGIVEYAETQGTTSLVAKRGFAKIYGQAQINWLISTLNSVPSGYGVVVCSHTMPLFNNVSIVQGFTQPNIATKMASYPFTQESYSAQTRTSGTTEGIIADIIKAYMDRSTLSATYEYTGNHWWSSSISIIPNVTVSADFSNANGKFMCYLCGHYHSDGVFKCSTTGYTKQTMIMLTSGTCEQANHNDDLPRCVDTDMQDCLLGLVIDVENEVVRITKIGSSLSIDGVDRVHYDIDVS